MARTKFSTEIVRNSDLLRYLYETFTLEEINTGELYHESIYKFFYINGKGLPNDSVNIDMQFNIDLDGKITCRWVPSTI